MLVSLLGPDSLDPQGERILDAEVLVDPSGRVRAVEGVEMDAPDLVVEQVAALLGRPVDADLRHGVGVIAAAVDRTEQAGREPRTQGELGHPDHPAFEVIGMIPAMIGTWMPAQAQRSQKS